MAKIGFMQGRLSPMVDGKIQCFPWDNWQAEFARAQACKIGLMEWTLDQERLYENPLMTAAGQAEIRELCQAHHLVIPSLTGDCFMQAPFWKASGDQQAELKKDFIAIAKACHVVGISLIVVPLVDNGALENDEQKVILTSFLNEQAALFRRLGVKVIFECDFAPAPLKHFIDELDAELFGVNYDIGNSAALGFDPTAEFTSYGDRVVNVHIKDRKRGGTTVPLGEGDADFDKVFSLLGQSGYKGNYILQTARSADNRHAEVLVKYRDAAVAWLKRHGS